MGVKQSKLCEVLAYLGFGEKPMIEPTRFYLWCKDCFASVRTCWDCQNFISGDKIQFEIRQSILNPKRGWYILTDAPKGRKQHLSWMIWKDLELHAGTGYDSCEHHYTSTAPGYYTTEKEAKMYLRDFKEKHDMADKIEINVKVNDKDVPLHEVSEQTLLTIRENSKPKPVPVFQVCNTNDDSGPRLIFKVTEDIANNAGRYVALSSAGEKYNSSDTIEDLWCPRLYTNIRELKLEEL